MLKMFTTQLFGVFRKIQEKEEQSIEDCARLIAQTIISGGNIYIKGFDELEEIASVINKSRERLPNVKPYEEGTTINTTDCILVFLRTRKDERLVEWINVAEEKDIPIIRISANEEEQERSDEDFHIDIKLLDGLVPSDHGQRVGYPPFMCGLYAYYALYFTVTEMLEEYDLGE